MADDSYLILGIIIGFIAYLLLYIGKGIQKYSIEGLKIDKTVKSKNSGIWIFGTILTTIYMFVQWGALLFAPINLIAPLEGVGLIVLLLFSFYVLKEAITKTKIISVVLIIIGIVFVTLFNMNTGDISISDFNLVNFLLFLIPVISMEIIAIFGTHLNNYKFAGLILGLTAGTFQAFQTVSKRITAVADPLITTAFTFVTFLMATLTLLITQFGLAKANANIVVPCFTSASVSLAILIGIMALNETIQFMQIIGIISVISGMILLTAFKEEKISER